MNKKTNQNDEFEMLRVGISDNASLLSDDELGELFGGYACARYCNMDYNPCPYGYCEGYVSDPEEPGYEE